MMQTLVEKWFFLTGVPIHALLLPSHHPALSHFSSWASLISFSYSKSPTYEPSGCELPKMRTCIRTSNCVSQFTCLEYIVMCMNPLQVVVLLCTLLYCTVQGTVVQYLYFKPRMSGSKHKSSGDVAGTTVFSRYHTVRLKMFSLFFVFVCFLCIICVKSIVNLLQYSTLQPTVVSQVPRLTLLDSQTNWTYKCTLRTQFICMQGTYCI